MKDWVTPFEETAANIKATASLLKETFCLRVCRTVKKLLSAFSLSHA